MTHYVMSRLPLSVFILLLTAPAFLAGKNINETLLKNIISDAKSVFQNDTVDVHAFRVDWYNDKVAPKYDLNYTNDTVALIFFTVPYVFNNSFIPFLCENMNDENVVKNSWEKFIRSKMEMVRQELNKKYDQNIPADDIMYSFEWVSGKARILVQTAGHVAGGAYYYQRKDVNPDPWKKDKKIYGVSIHPQYGGYFSLDAVIILRNSQYPEMKEKKPEDVIKSQKKRIELLTIYNTNWKNPKWREMFLLKRKYTEEHMWYELTYGPERENLVSYLLYRHCKKNLIPIWSILPQKMKKDF